MKFPTHDRRWLTSHALHPSEEKIIQEKIIGYVDHHFFTHLQNINMPIQEQEATEDSDLLLTMYSNFKYILIVTRSVLDEAL